MAEIFRIYLGRLRAELMGSQGMRQYWRDQVAEAGGVPVKGCSITIRVLPNKVMISGAADRK